MTDAGAGLRVMAWPAFEGREVQPYTALLYEHVAKLGVAVEPFSLRRLLASPPQICHAHWPEYVLKRRPRIHALARAVAVLLALAQARLRGTVILWTVHNLEPHDEGPADRLVSRPYWWVFSRLVGGYIALSHGGQPAILARHPVLAAKPHAVVPLGHYRHEYGRGRSRQEARAALHLDATATIYLFIGQIRAYKAVPDLVRAFRQVSDARSLLVVAGQPSDDAMAAELRRVAGAEARVRLELRFLSNEEVSLFVSAADLVVMPAPKAFNSATVLLALSLGRPVLAPDTPSFCEIQSRVTARWLATFAGPLTGAVLKDAVQAVARDGEPDLTPFEWPAIARQTVDFYCRVARAGRA